jgi:predicted PurR-regulated permease PerM
LGAIGGLLTWGIVGVFLGPVIVAVCHQLTIRWLETEAEQAPEDTLETAFTRPKDDGP